MNEPARDAPLSVTLLPVPHFPLHGLALCVDALRIANREALRVAFSWRIASIDGGAVISSAGVEIAADLGIDAIDYSPVTVLLAAYEPNDAVSDRLLNWLRRQDRCGAMIGCVDTGALLLARAGIARGETLCVHRNALHAAREDHPAVTFTDQPFAMGARRLSSAGGIAAFDMMLALIEHHAGRDLAERVARIANHRRHRRNEGEAASGHARTHPVLGRCVELMQANVEAPLSLGELADKSGAPPWTLRRLFRRQLDCTPGDYYRQVRLERARALLAYSHLSLAQVAAACGFADAASLSHGFRRRFGLPPSQARHDDPGLPDRSEGV